MANIIRLTADEVETVAAQFDTASDDTQNIITKLDSVVNEMSSSWEGASYTAFNENFDSLKPQLDSVVELYTQLAQQLRYVVKTIVETDESLANSISG